MDVTTVLESKEMEKEEFSLWSNCTKELLIRIFKFLPHSDLLQVRLVCKYWNELAQWPEFKRKSKLIINTHNVSEIHDYLLKDKQSHGRLCYDTLEIYGLLCHDRLQLILKSIGPAIYKLSLYKSSVFAILNDSFPKLEELIVLDTGILHGADGFVINLNELKNLKSLDIGSNFVAPYIKKDLITSLTRQTCLNMQKLCLDITWEHESFVIYALKVHCNSLKHLELIFRTNPQMTAEWKRVSEQFGRLETLKITGATSCLWLKEVFTSLPKETPLKHCDLSGCLLLDDSLLKLIVHKWHSSLENMELMYCTYVTDEGIKDLDILRHTLRSLNIDNCSKVSGKGLLQGLAAEENTSLKTLILSNMLNIGLESGNLLARRLPQLTFFSLESCGNSVRDSTLGHIFRHQLKLQYLILDGCSHITDKGFLGFGLNPAPISNLKGLQTLSLRGCRQISDHVFANGFQFSELRKLDLTGCVKITSSGIEELVKNCPAIEDFNLSSCSKVDDRAILHLAKGLSRLKRLSVNYCFSLTAKSLDYLMDLCWFLKNFSGEGVDFLNSQTNDKRDEYSLWLHVKSK